MLGLLGLLGLGLGLRAGLDARGLLCGAEGAEGLERPVAHRLGHPALADLVDALARGSVRARARARARARVVLGLGSATLTRTLRVGASYPEPSPDLVARRVEAAADERRPVAGSLRV